MSEAGPSLTNHTETSEAGARARRRAVVSISRRGAAPVYAILILLVFYTLYFARDVVVPVAIAVLLSLLLSPVIARLKRLRVPEPLSAALVVAMLVGAFFYGLYSLSAPAAQWFDRMPQVMGEIQGKLGALKRPVEQVQKASREVEELAEVEGGAPEVTIKGTSLAGHFVLGTTAFFAQATVVVILVYFLLASGDLFMRRLVRALSTGREKRRAVEIAHNLKRDVTTYLGTITLINAGLGVAVGTVMGLLGMPNPVLWGVLAAFFNFIPYLGAIVMLGIVTVVALLSFDETSAILLPPLAFFTLTTLEAYLLTPALVGKRLTLNPAIVFVSLVLWGWLWGVPGAILAVPILVTLKAVADRVETLSPISLFFGRQDE